MSCNLLVAIAAVVHLHKKAHLLTERQVVRLQDGECAFVIFHILAVDTIHWQSHAKRLEARLAVGDNKLPIGLGFSLNLNTGGLHHYVGALDGCGQGLNACSCLRCPLLGNEEYIGKAHIVGLTGELEQCYQLVVAGIGAIGKCCGATANGLDERHGSLLLWHSAGHKALLNCCWSEVLSIYNLALEQVEQREDGLAIDEFHIVERYHGSNHHISAAGVVGVPEKHGIVHSVVVEVYLVAIVGCGE